MQPVREKQGNMNRSHTQAYIYTEKGLGFKANSANESVTLREGRSTLHTELRSQNQTVAKKLKQSPNQIFFSPNMTYFKSTQTKTTTPPPPPYFPSFLPPPQNKQMTTSSYSHVRRANKRYAHVVYFLYLLV